MAIKPELVMKSYKAFIKMRTPYQVTFDMSNDGAIFFLLTEQTPKNPAEPEYVFLDCVKGTPLSMEGFETTVLEKKDPMTFEKQLIARCKGCTLNKSGVICGLLLHNYSINDIYKNNNVILPKQALKELSQWINYKGGMSALDRAELERQREAEREKRKQFELMKAKRNAHLDTLNR